MERINKCPICNSNVETSKDYQRDMIFCSCPVCGRFEYGTKDVGFFDENHLSAYLFYNAFSSKMDGERRYHTTLNKEKCDAYKSEHIQDTDLHRLPVHMDSDLVEAWYPKTFSERVDRVLLYVNDHTKHMGQQIYFSFYSMLSLLFVDRKETYHSEEIIWRDENECKSESKFLLDYLSDNSLISYTFGTSVDQALFLTLMPKGYARIDAIQKLTSYGRGALVAMKFGNDTIPLREAIRKGIADAGYFAVFIDEVQHNDFITPELLKHIRDSKFVVVDLTHKNNGAYFEEGYAMGLGKQVIQLCKKDVQLHFDIAQKNTIMWGEEDDIPVMLANRIKATID